MRICFVGGFTSGGTERITYLLGNELSAKYKDLSISILNMSCCKPVFPLSSELLYSELESKYRNGIISRIRGIRHFIKCNKIDILISIEAMMGIFTIPATMGLRCKNICWDHANFYQTQGSRWIQCIRRLWLMYADAYILLTKRDLMNYKRFFKPKCRLIHIYNPIKLISGSSQNYDINSRIIVSAGHIYHIKNFEIIPDIVKAIGDNFEGWQWHIYGSGSHEDEQKLRNKIESYGLSQKIILMGRAYDMDKVYDKAAIYALTSLQEGLPTVLLEAQLHGLPCVSFDIETGPDEIIHNNCDGYLVEPYDVVKYAKVLRNLILNDDLRMQYSIMARNSIKRFNIDEVINTWHGLINNIYYDRK